MRLLFQPLAALGFLSVFLLVLGEAFSIGSSDSSLTASPGEELGYFSALGCLRLISFDVRTLLVVGVVAVVKIVIIYGIGSAVFVSGDPFPDVRALIPARGLS